MLHRLDADPDPAGGTPQARAGTRPRAGTGEPALGGAGGLQIWDRYAVGPVAGLITMAFLSWGLGRPAFWLDEGASVIATQRSWPDLFRLLPGADAPLVPYYAVLKTVTGLLRALVPGITAHPEVLYRLVSAVAVAVACGLLIGWLARQVPRRLVLVIGVLLPLVGGLSRYGQEARPYGLVLLGAVSATVLWTVMIRDGRYRWMAGYAVTVAAMVALHDLTAVLVAAHGVAALLAVGPGERRTALRRTLAAAAVGLLLVSPLAVTAARNGQGAGRFVTLTPAHLVWALAGATRSIGTPALGLGPVMLLAVVGLSQIRSPRYRFVAGLATAWALVPPALLLPAVVLRPNLLIARYLLFTVPAWAVLAGLGTITLAEIGRSLSDRVGLPRPATGFVTAGVMVAALMATIAVQAPTLTGVRSVQGHGENIQPALAVADEAADAGLPIVVSSRLGATEVDAYSGATARRLVGLAVQPGTMIWPVVAPYQVRKQLLRRDSRVLLLLRDVAGPCVQYPGPTSEAEISRCMPPVLRRLRFRVVTPGVGGFGWSISTLVRIRSLR